MKIASQLLSSTQSEGIKTASLSEDAATFHGALTAASGAKGVISPASHPANPKQSESVSPRATESKKKGVASGSPLTATVSVSIPPSSKPSVQSVTEIPAAIAVPSNGDVPTQVVIPASIGFDAGIYLSDDKGASASSPASISSSVSLPASKRFSDLRSAENVSPIGSSRESVDLASAGAADETGSIPNTSKPTLQASATPVLEPAASKALAADQVSDDSKTADAPTFHSSANSADPTILAAQQSAVAGAQSAAAPVSLPSLSSANESQPVSAVATSKGANANSISDELNNAGSRQTLTTASKTKPASSSSAVRGKITDDKDADVQAENTPQANAAVVKVLETSGAISHGASESHAAIDAGILQPTPQQPTFSDGPNHIAQAMQNVNISTDSAAQAVHGQTSSDSQGMQGVTSAQLTQSMRSSEMKLGMQSTEFGNISISTSLNRQTISAQISMDHAELGKALAVHLPAIEEKLGSAYGLQAKVELRENSHPSSSNDSGYSSSGNQSREQRQSSRDSSTAARSATVERVTNHSTFTATTPVASGSRLDIRI